MKVTRKQLKRIINEAMDGDFFSDREANPHDGSMYGEPEGGYDGSLMDLEDYQRLENLLQKDLKVFLRGGYTKEDIIEVLKSIVEDA